MKAVDPSIKIYAGYESPNIVRTMGDKHPYDGVVVHPYTNQGNIPKATTIDELAPFPDALLGTIGQEIRAYQDLIDQTVARSGAVRSG